MNISVRIDQTNSEGRVAHFFDIELSLYFMACRKFMFERNHEKPQKLPVFGNINIKTTPQLKNVSFERMLKV